MSMNYVERTGKVKFTSGLVDYKAEGILHLEHVKIPCEIGYVDGYDNFTGKKLLQPTHLFIKAGVTDEGDHYENQTIDLSIRKDIAVEKEV